MDFSYNDVLEHVDLNNMVLSAKGWGVINGLGVDASSNMSVNVAAGNCFVDEVKYTEGSTVNIAIAAADATNPRKDLIIYDTSAGNPAAVTGSPAAIPQPPDIPSGDILLAMVDVSANVTVIYAADITDKIIIVDEYILIAIPTDDLLNSDDTEETTQSESYIKIKDFSALIGNLDSTHSAFRIKFDLKIDSAGPTAYGQVYKNGVAHGTEQMNTTTTYQTKSEDISGWSAGDTIELWVKVGTAIRTAHVKNFRVYGRFEVVKPLDW